MTILPDRSSDVSLRSFVGFKPRLDISSFPTSRNDTHEPTLVSGEDSECVAQPLPDEAVPAAVLTQALRKRGLRHQVTGISQN